MRGGVGLAKIFSMLAISPLGNGGTYFRGGLAQR